MKKVTLLKLRESGSLIQKYYIYTGSTHPRQFPFNNYHRWKVMNTLGFTGCWYIEETHNFILKSIPRTITLNAGELLDLDSPVIEEIYNACS